MAQEKKYWSSLDELNAAEPAAEDTGDLGILKSAREAVTNEATPRRDFLKMLGFSVTAAAVAASCEMPVRKSIPYTVKPEEIIPGIPNFYASAYTKNGIFNSVLVRTREGRPIMIEGNRHSEHASGGVDKKVYADLLNLYDHARIKFPMKDGEKTDWSTLDAEITEKLNATAGGDIAILSGTIQSPSTRKAIEAFQAAYPNAQHYTYDADSASGQIEANEAVFGVRALADHHFDKADLVVSIGADFLNTWGNSEEFTKAYASRRKVDADNTEMNRHVQIEAMPSLTGANADRRVIVRPSEEDMAVLRLYNLVARATGGQTLSDDSGFENPALEETAQELLNARGRSLVVSGSRSKEAQMLVAGINDMLGNYEKTLSIARPAYYKQGVDSDVFGLLDEMNAGRVKALIVMDANPSFTLGAAFDEALANVDTTVSLSERINETTAKVQYLAPDHHWLESWNDAIPKAGVLATAQPTIAPLFTTRQAPESLLRWAGRDVTYYDFMREVWQTDLMPLQNTFASFETMWRNTVHDGSMSYPAEPEAVTRDMSGLSAAAASVKQGFQPADLELKLYVKGQIGDGYYADNPWAQELADPMSRICWDNYLLADPKWVRANGFLHNHKNRAYKVARVTVAGTELELPVVELPGMAPNSFAVAIGYGREHTINDLLNRGANAYPVRNATAGRFTWTTSIDAIEDAGREEMIAIVQQHHSLTHTVLGGSEDDVLTTEKTRHIVKETDLETYRKDVDGDLGGALYNTIGPDETPRRDWLKKHLHSLYGETAWEDEKSEFAQYYGGAHVEKQANGHHWGMAIDLNSCIGCGACVMACNAENNVPVVGQNEVRRAHDMNWLRIDKYHSGDEENPDVVFQPMLCQHCDNAPCENVCPVSATNHSSEGLNQMTYNRCIGTRYCANNCPYKVRRFNWFDYQGADSFAEGTVFNNDFDGQQRIGGAFGPAEGENLNLHNPLSRMVLNPDVTIRGRGVIEKCSFCVQRIQYSRLEAKKGDRPLKDGEIVTACQSACPSNAITFGDTNNPDAEVSKKWRDDRAFGVIEEIHTLPSVQYLTKVRNRPSDKTTA